MPTLFDSKRFHIFAPSICGSQGGIQLYSAFFLQALQNLCPQGEYEVFLKHDVDLQILSDRNYLPKTRFHFAGSYPPFAHLFSLLKLFLKVFYNIPI